MKDNFEVNFIGVGFPRCGTTWISKCLEEHPDICFSNKKELHFFNNDFDYDKGIGYYKTLFNYNGEKSVGEFTPEYFIYDKTIERIKKHYPKAKLIFALRNPVSRAFSQYLYRKRKTGKEYPIEEIFSQQDLPYEEQILYPGFYSYHLSRWIKDLPKDQYLILIHKDSTDNPEAFIKKIYKFVGVDENFVPPSLKKEVNVSKGLVYHSRIIQNIYAFRTKIKRGLLGRRLIEFLKKLGFSKIVGWVISKNFKGNKGEENEVLSDNVREKIREVYKDDIKRLEKFLGRDLSFWK